ncbi:MAG TPA: MarR family transcriptional regulator [Candidatus Limnocylindria bacterium]
MAVKRKRAELVASIRAGFQRVSGQSVVLSGVIAEKFGLAPSDLECLGFLQLEGPITAGRLAQLTGLTTGAVTRMIDRLEAGKYVRRRDDPNDRRRVVVELNPERMKEFAPFYGPMAENSTQLLARYTDEELALIVDLLDEQLQVGLRHAARIQAMPGPRGRKRVKLKAKVLGQKIRVEF